MVDRRRRIFGDAYGPRRFFVDPAQIGLRTYARRLLVRDAQIPAHACATRRFPRTPSLATVPACGFAPGVEISPALLAWDADPAIQVVQAA
jgi:hypothetical protein